MASADEIRYGLTSVQKALPIIAASLVVALFIAIVNWVDRSTSVPSVKDVVIAGIVAAGAVVIVSPGYGITLTPNEAIVHNLERRVIKRDEILSVLVQRRLGIKAVMICESSGRRTSLRAPIGFFDRNFDQKCHVIRNWSGTAGSGDGVPGDG